MRRRDFITFLNGTVVIWPILARAAVGNVGDWVSEHHITRREHRASACVSPGLKESGYVEGENVAIDYHWAENQSDRLEEFAADLVRRRVALIVTSGGPASAFAAKAATATIPIVFVVNEDPVKLGLVASLARPGGNLTGFNIYFSEVVAKRLALLRELVPTAIRIAVLVNPVNATVTETTVRDVKAAARTMGLQVKVFNASTGREIDTAFATFANERPDALFVAGDPYFADRRVQLAAFRMVGRRCGVTYLANLSGKDGRQTCEKTRKATICTISCGHLGFFVGY